MKILFLSNESEGLYNFRREVVEKMCEIAEVYLCMPVGKRLDYWESIGAKFIPCSFNRHSTNPVVEIKQVIFYKKLLNQLKPDICFTYTIKPNIYGGVACAAKNIPYVVNITGLGTAVENPGILQKLTLFLYKYGLRKAQKVFFQNSASIDFMRKHGVLNGGYDLLPGSGVNLEHFQPLEYPTLDTVDFVFIGRVMREKGIDQYLEAAEYIKKKHSACVFHICGSCVEEYKPIISNYVEKGIVVFHGQMSDIREIHRISQCTIHPSYYPEGMSNVLLESCACGRPVITTDRPGCRETVDDGINGFIIKQRDSQDLIDKIERFLALPWIQRREMGLAGRAKVEREFDRQIVVGKYLETIREACHD